MCETFRQLIAADRWFPPGTPVSSTRKLISSSSFHRLAMTLAAAEALTPNTPNQTETTHTYPPTYTHTHTHIAKAPYTEQVHEIT